MADDHTNEEEKRNPFKMSFNRLPEPIEQENVEGENIISKIKEESENVKEEEMTVNKPIDHDNFQTFKKKKSNSFEPLEPSEEIKMMPKQFQSQKKVERLKMSKLKALETKSAKQYLIPQENAKINAIPDD